MNDILLSDFHVEVQPVTNITKHPNADTLSIGECCGAPVIFRTGEYQEGQLAVYLPVDAVVPADDERWAFLDGKRRIKARRLRGVFSMGILTQPDPSWPAGFNAQETLRIEKYEPVVHSVQILNTESEKNPGYLPHYGIESYRRHKHILQIGEEVVLTEKLHGCQGSAIYRDGRLWVASHYHYKKFDERNLWWQVAIQNEFETKLAPANGIGFFFEVYGQVQDLKYGANAGELFVRVFDAYDSINKKWLGYEELFNVCEEVGLDMVPLLYRGPWSEELLSESNGNSIVPGAKNIREGFVVKPVIERIANHFGRVNLKVVGSDFLLRKGG